MSFCDPKSVSNKPFFFPRFLQGFGNRPIRPALASAYGVVFLVAGYAVFHITLRLSFSQNFTTDDADAALLVERLQTGYQIHQPPLYEWLLFASHQIFGFTLFSALVVKYALILIAALSIYGVGVFVIQHRGWAVLCVASYSLFYQIGWNLLEGTTHTLTVIAFSAVTLFAFVWALRRPRIFVYGILGIAIGLGSLSKFSYLLFFLLLVVCALAYAPIRQRVRPFGFLLSLVIAFLIFSPYAVWLAGEEEVVSEVFAKMSAERRGLSELLGLQSGLKAAINAFLYSLLFLPLVLMLFRRNLLQAHGQVRQIFFNDEPVLGYLAIVFTFGLLAIVFAAGLGGIDNLKERHLHPFFLPLPLLVFAILARQTVGAVALGWFKFLLLGVFFTVALVRATTLAFPLEDVCGRCREMVPYEKLFQQLAPLPDIPVLAADPYTAVNLTRLLKRRVFLLGKSNSNFPETSKCLVVWRVFEQSQPDRRVRVLEKILPSLELRDLSPRKTVEAQAVQLMEGSRYHKVSWQTPFIQDFRITEWRSTVLNSPSICAGFAG